MPALFTSTSSRPQRSTVARTIPSTSAATDTSAWTEAASPPLSAICRATRSALSPSRSAHITFAPSWPNSAAVARPMPDAAPVTSATLSFSRIVSSCPPVILSEARNLDYSNCAPSGPPSGRWPIVLRRHGRLQELDDRSGRLLRLLPEEHMAYPRYDPHLRAGYALQQDIRVPHRKQLVAVAVDDQRRRRDPRQPLVSIELLDRHELPADALPRRGGGQPGADDPGPELRPGTLHELRRRRREQELPDRVQRRPPALARARDNLRVRRHAVGEAAGRAAQDQPLHRLRVVQRQLLGDHPTHRDAQHVRARDAYLPKEAGRILRHQRHGQLAGRLIAQPRAAVGEADDLKV